MHKQTHSFLQRMNPRLILLGAVCVAASFTVGIHTTADLQPISLIEAGSLQISGDLDGNGSVELNDAIVALEIVRGYREASPEQLKADPNEDGSISVDDALSILSTLSRHH